MSLETLKISSQELEELLNLNIVSVIAVDFYRALILKNKKKLGSLLFTEFFIFLFSTIFVLPVILLFSRISGAIAQNALTIILAICLSLVFICNFWLWQQAKRSRYLAKLIEKVDKYNAVVDAILFLSKLEFAQKFTQNMNKTIEILETTKNSLINSLKIATSFLKRKTIFNNFNQLLMELETNLTSLMTFDIHNQSSEYGQLLNHALEIGISVHKEVKSLQRKSEI